LPSGCLCGCLLTNGSCRQKRTEGSGYNDRCCRNGRCSRSSGRSRNAGYNSSDRSLRFRRANQSTGGLAHNASLTSRRDSSYPGPLCNHISPFASCCRCQRESTQTPI
ncbi:unnamed protein product, partial [Ectocarpus sp. 13 AM-2016]